ncbi:MAG: penicillin-binding protein [Clostridiales Family XIII bacterium]|jgi:penicillin-binding protein 2|nr:penicillin-binding protein [Clostridiales Family XIII bacterium]
MKWMKARDNQLMTLIGILLLLLFLRLFVLTVMQHDTWTNAADSNDRRSLYEVAPRGEIFDRYGRLLAGNLPSFTVQFSRGNMGSAEINATSAKIIEILEANGEKYIDNLPILYEGGFFEYTYRREVESWLEYQGMPADFTAEQAFEEIRRRYGIGEELDQYAAQTELINEYGVTPPISVRTMVYSRDLDKNKFLERYGLDTELPARDAFFAIRDRYGIDKSLSVEEARKIMVLRNELSLLGYRQFVPANIAAGVSDSTVLQIKERQSSLRGISVAGESVRSYPNGSTASHVLGYMGKISESNTEHYVNELGYRPTDLIGLDGIENSMESYLKGKDGIKEVQVNSRGELVSVISEEPAEKGKDIYLSIDLELQKSVEEILDRGLAALQTGGVFESQWGDYKFRDAQPNANVGSVVVLDVKTGEPLALVNAPNFDPNLFSTGISNENWNALQSQNPRDSLSPRPLYNVASKTAVQPGSTFKPITAITALESGLNPNAKLYDGGAVTVGNHSYGCLLWNTSRGSHGNIDLYQALEVSCNYYFYNIATGMDYAKNKPLSYKGDISIGKIMSYAEQFGLGLPTGIELSETVAAVPTAEKKMASQKSLLQRHLLNNAEEYFKPEVLRNQAQLGQQIDTIVNWTEENPVRSELIKRMGELGIREEMVSEVADTCKFTFYNYAQWTLGDELNIAIGQGENAYTPVQMANYIATLGNGGVHNQVSLIRTIEDVEIERPTGEMVQLSDDAYLEDVITGMKRVVSGSRGSLRSTFAGFPVSVAAKTGTAQKSGKIQPPDEVEYIQEHLKGIDATLNWEDVETEMNRLLSEYPGIYTSQSKAVRKAVTNLSSRRTIEDDIDSFKDSYKPFAWVVALAPAEDPHIAVAVLIFQGNSSLNAAPVAKEVIAKYMNLEKEYEDYSLENVLN